MNTMKRPKLGKHQRRMLRHLSSAGVSGCSVSELGDSLPSSTVRLGLAGLIARGYVLRKKDELNSRAHRYFIRELGLEWTGGSDE